MKGRSWCSHETTSLSFYLVVLSTLKLFWPQTIRAAKELLGGTRPRWAPIGGESPPLAGIWRNLGAPAVHAALTRHGAWRGIPTFTPPPGWFGGGNPSTFSGGTREQPTEGNRGPPALPHPLRQVPALRQVPNPSHLGTHPLPTGTRTPISVQPVLLGTTFRQVPTQRSSPGGQAARSSGTRGSVMCPPHSVGSVTARPSPPRPRRPRGTPVGRLPLGAHAPQPCRGTRSTRTTGRRRHRRSRPRRRGQRFRRATHSRLVADNSTPGLRRARLFGGV